MSSISKMVTPDGAQYDIRDAAALKAAAAAPAFSSSAAYAEGDYVTYEGLLYRATAARAAGAWNSGSGFAEKVLAPMVDGKLGPYPFVASAVSSGTVTLQPFANNQLDLSEASGTTAFTVAFAASPVSGTMRDLWFVVKTGLLAPTVTWPSGVVAADGDSDNLVADANATLAFHVVECASGVFAVYKQVLELGGVQLPYDAEVEYLEATGTQWIDTGVGASSYISVAIRGAWIDLTAQIEQGLMSVDSGNTFLEAFNIQSYSAKIRWTIGSKEAVTPVITAGTFYDIEGSRTGVNVDDIHYNMSDTVSDFTSQYTIPLFAWRRASRFIQFSKTRIALCKLYDTGALVRDFIPVRVGSGGNAVGYMYDRANPTGGPYGNGLYDNSGTGAFVVGPDKT